MPSQPSCCLARRHVRLLEQKRPLFQAFMTRSLLTAVALQDCSDGQNNQRQLAKGYCGLLLGMSCLWCNAGATLLLSKGTVFGIPYNAYVSCVLLQQTTSLLRKYCGPFDVVLSILQTSLGKVQACCINTDPGKVVKALQAHQSQYVW